MYKALFIDVDGTLVTSKDSLPSRKVKEALLKLKNKNIYICIVTTRQFSKIENICKDLGLSGLAIVSAGAQIIDIKTGEYIYEYVIDNKSTTKICELLKNFEKKIDFWIQDDGVDCKYSVSYAPNKPFAIIVHNITDQIADKIIKQVLSVVEVFCTSVPTYQKGFVDLCISNKRATKQHGVEVVTEIIGVSKKETVGIGDGENDKAFLMSCGLKIAMGNAVSDVKKIADYIAPDVNEDGIVFAIDKLPI